MEYHRSPGPLKRLQGFVCVIEILENGKENGNYSNIDDSDCIGTNTGSIPAFLANQP